MGPVTGEGRKGYLVFQKGLLGWACSSTDQCGYLMVIGSSD